MNTVLFVNATIVFFSENLFLVNIFREKVLDIRPKSVRAVEMTMYVHWSCKNINRTDDHV